MMPIEWTDTLNGSHLLVSVFHSCVNVVNVRNFQNILSVWVAYSSFWGWVGWSSSNC